MSMSDGKQDDYTGGCLCGRVRYRATGRPYHLTHCHCMTCRRASGAAFVSWFSVRRPDFAFVSGEPVWYASSQQGERGFCAACGTALVFRQAGTDEIDVTICSLDDPDALTPEDHTWTSRQLPWVRLADGLPRHPRQRPETEPEGDNETQAITQPFNQAEAP